MNWVLSRLKEPSTYYGLGVLVAGIAAHFAPAEWGAFLSGVSLILGGGAIATPDRRVY